jgi:peptidoglycan/LPS O-acetylase OafA/YrhL
MKETPFYRPDIDGLRAIAVLSVVLYHFDIPGFKGGFVGVDVFFVISGYLITQVIYKEIDAGTFSLLQFYDRRFRRILPAMLTVILCTVVAGYLILFPKDYELLGEQAAYSALGLANFYFLWNTGYFDPSAEMLPLLHMWSLAVEEQFYLVWPILLAALAKAAGSSHKSTLTALGIIGVTSLTSAAYLVAVDPKQAFFLPYTRAWELALGAALVFLPVIQTQRLAERTGAIGIALIIASVLLLDAKYPFPGLTALFPCVGAALVVCPKAIDTATSRALSLRSAVAVGLISYSLYLWHWPVLVFFKYFAHASGPTKPEALLLFIVALALSALSWRFVEQPFRQKRYRAPVTVSAGLVGLSLAATMGFGVHAVAGAPWRLRPEHQKVANFLAYEQTTYHSSKQQKCNARDKETNTETLSLTCFQGELTKSNILLIGDSHAGHFLAALKEAFPNVHFSPIITSRCRPVLKSKGSAHCVDLMRRVYEDIVPHHRFDAIILSARWRSGQSQLVPESVNYLLRFTPRVIVFGQTIEYRDNLPAILARSEMPRRNTPMSELEMFDKSKNVDDDLRSRLQGTRAEYFSVLDAICPERHCITTVYDGIPAAWDRTHLTFEGATFVLEKFKAHSLRFERPASPEHSSFPQPK